MRKLLPILLVTSSTASAQTGPGGIGASGSNVLWLDANNGVTHLSGAVSQWSDRSGNVNHAYLPGSIPLATPTLQTNVVNGYPVLTFDGVDDQLWVPDAASIDLTAWHIFSVHTATVQKDYNAWLVKGDDAQENFEMLSYANGNIHTPTYYTDLTRTIPSSAAGQVVTGTFDVFEYSYNPANGRAVFKNGASIHTDTDSKTPMTNNLPLYIGNERSTTGRNINGRMAEVIIFNSRLNSAQRIILANYLAAKYGRPMAANDVFQQDDATNGDFDHDVAGIGRVNSSNQHNDSRGSGIVRLSNPSDLNNNEFLIWGHNNAPLTAFGSSDFPTGLQGRLHRVWRVSELNTAGSTAVDVGGVDISFDLAGLGTVTPSHLRLLVDTDGDGVFNDETPISGATSLGGSIYQFAGVTALQNGRRFTLGTTNIGSTPLPIELVSFEANAQGSNEVALEWVTASELNNDRFTVERSLDLQAWTGVLSVQAAGNSHSPIEYTAIDRTAPLGINYYRLRQTDVDGTSTVSDVRAVEVTGKALEPVVYPNPNDGAFTVYLPWSSDAAAQVTLFDAVERSVGSINVAGTGSPQRVPMQEALLPGAYTLVVEHQGERSTQRFMVAR